MTWPITKLYQVNATPIRMKNWINAMPMATVGTVTGDSKNAVNTGLAGRGNRTRTKAAPIAKTVAKPAARRPIPRLINVAVPMRWIEAMLAYHSNDSDFGGNSINWEPLNDTTTVKKTGNIKNSSAAHPATLTKRRKDLSSNIDPHDLSHQYGINDDDQE